MPERGAIFCFDPKKVLTLRCGPNHAHFAVAMLSIERMSVDNIARIRWDCTMLHRMTSIRMPQNEVANSVPNHEHNGKLVLIQKRTEKHNTTGVVLWTYVKVARGQPYYDCATRLGCLVHGVVLLQRMTTLVECMAGQLETNATRTARPWHHTSTHPS